MVSNFKLPNHAEKVKQSEPVNSADAVRFPGFNDCKNPLVCMAFRRDIEQGNLITVITPFTGLVDHSGTAAAKSNYWEQLKRKYAPDLKQILTEHPSWAKDLGMTEKQVREFKPEDVSPVDFVDVPGDHRAR